VFYDSERTSVCNFIGEQQNLLAFQVQCHPGQQAMLANASSPGKLKPLEEKVAVTLVKSVQ
jgi:hypothetical protein